MRLADLQRGNESSLSKLSEFRNSTSLDSNRPQNEVFHKYKNAHKFFGFIEIQIDGCEPFVMYSNNDDLVAMTYFWYGPDSYERKSIEEWVKRVKGKKTILDVGSFSGLYSLTAAAAKGRVSDARIYAFEPTRRVYSRLLANVQANRLERTVNLCDYAVSDGIGLVNFHQYRGENVLGNGASFVDKGIPTTSSSEVVQAVSLDWFVRDNNISPELVKIDVEQAEVLALEGMQQVLQASKPDILIEVARNTAQDVSDLLKKHGYRIYSIDEEKQSLVPFDGKTCTKVMNLLAECKD